MKENADSLYEQFIQGNAMDKAQCIAAYNEVKNKYTEALQLSQHDEVVKHKILDVDRRLSTLNM